MNASVLIPNFNNGVQAGKPGYEIDFISDCIASLLANSDDVEIIVFDDASTDDSCASLERWAARGDIKLILSDENVGIAAASNRLVTEAQSDILVRFDGDATMDTPHWDSIMRAAFAQLPPDAGALGPIQLSPGRPWPHAFGDTFFDRAVGYRHLTELDPGPPFNGTRMREVDHTMGACYMMKRAMLEDVDGYDEALFRADSIDLTIRALMKNWRVYVTPEIRFMHYHSCQLARGAPADIPANSLADRQRILEKCGFDWRCAHKNPGVMAVAKMHEGTVLGERAWAAVR